MPAGSTSTKAKIAKRLVEVLDYFDDEHPQATVMDIVRRYDRPQSSTSELLSSMVELGLLYKNPCSRSFSPTPRAAMMASAPQPAIIRDGSLVKLVDRLASHTDLCVVVCGLVGLNAQIFSYKPGERIIRRTDNRDLSSGLLDELTNSALGLLLLSTVQQPRRDGMLRRLNAEASDDRKFVHAEMVARVNRCIDTGSSIGPAGFGSNAHACSILIPGQPEHQPLAVGFLYNEMDDVHVGTLLECLHSAVYDLERPAPVETRHLSLVSNAA